MSINNQEISILVIYYTKSKILFQKEFSSYSNFGSLLDYFNKNIKKDNNFLLKKKYLINNKEIKKTDLLINLIQTYDLSKKITNVEFSIEIDENNNIGDDNMPCFKKILQPARGDFGIYVFIPENGTISLEQYPKNLEIKYELEKFNIDSAYCNSPNSLFISGGRFNEEKITRFWVIDNEIYSIKKYDMLFPKAKHSMIYIKHNDKELIFLAGGDDLKTFYYDIKNNNFVNWGNMNGLHSGPGLIQINDYLYCFHLIKDENSKIFFERTNLNEQKHIWEKIYPDFSKEDFKNNIINNDFGLSRCSKGRVMLLGGNFNNPHSYFYEINKNLFSINENSNNQFIPLIDKTFYKINETHNITLPAYLRRQVEIVTFNKIKCTIRKIYFNQNEKNKKIKFKNIYKRNLSIGKIKVELKAEDPNKIHYKNNNHIPFNDSNASNNNHNEIYENPILFNISENENSKNKNLITENLIIYDKIKNNKKIEINNSENKNNNKLKQFNTKPIDIKNKNNIFFKKRNININLDNGIETDDNIIDNQDDEFESQNMNKKENNIFNKIQSNGQKSDFNIVENGENLNKNNYIKESNNENNNSEMNNILSDNNIHIDNENNIAMSENEKNYNYILEGKNDSQNHEEDIYMNNGEEELNNINIDNNKQNNYDKNNIGQNNENNDNDKENYYENNEVEEQNEYDESNRDENIDEFDEGQNYYEGGFENLENIDEENIEEDEEVLERDRFEQTIIQPIGEDIIQIENYPIYFYEESNFCDYEYIPEDID